MDIAPNSDKFLNDKPKEEPAPKRVEAPVTSGSTRTKRKERKFLASLFEVDDASKIGDHILYDVLVPSFKRAISDLITDSIDIALYGEKRSSGKSKAERYSYSKYYDDKNSRRRESEPRRSAYEHDDVKIPSRKEAEEVLIRMEEILETYGSVTVADYYDLNGITPEYTDNKYGWNRTTFRYVEVVRLGDGYTLNLPKAIPLA